MSATAALREALSQGISSGNLVDTKIILYSYRDSSGRVCRPKVLYANSHVLKTVPYFNDLLFGSFAEAQSRDFGEGAIDEEEFAEDYGYSSDSDLEDDSDGRVAPAVVPPEEKKRLCEEHEERIEKGKIVKIPDMALVTFQAFLMYLYTNVIEFAPFGSKGNRRSRSAEIVTPPEDKVPKPSPKSIYRLADKYDVPALKTLALNYMRGELAKCDIVEEAFSRFASRYDEIRSLYINQLAFVWANNSTTETTRASFDNKVDSFAKGELEHATEMLSTLWGIINRGGEIKVPLNTSPATAEVVSPAHWAAVKIALIKSIGKGIFFDRKYWARHSNPRGVFKPVYFSSIVMGDRVQHLNSLVIYLEGRNALMIYLMWNPNVDSDCEGDLMGVVDGALKTEEEKEEKARAVLSTGSFSAWKSLFFYRCTDMISFAPLRSQGVESRLNYIRGRNTAATPPPCSPKTIYVLASLVGKPSTNVFHMTLTEQLKLGIQPLCDRAFADIKSKLSSDNVVEEVFSWFTARQYRIMDMQCDLLTSDFRDPTTITLMQENIGRISNGSSSHYASALKLGFKKAFQLKKRDISVLLQCSNDNCGWHSNPVTHSSVGSNIFCPKCSNNAYGYPVVSYHMKCAGCGYKRTGDHTSCQSCRRKFM